jgi:hypothetical protein
MAMQTTRLVAQQVFKRMELRRARTPAESTVNKVALTPTLSATYSGDTACKGPVNDRNSGIYRGRSYRGSRRLLLRRRQLGPL